MKDRRATITIEHPDFTSASVVKTGKLYSGGAAVEANYLGEWLVAEDGKAQQFHGGKITVAFDTQLQNTPKKPKNIIPEGPDWGYWHDHRHRHRSTDIFTFHPDHR
jgi:hypothetical protein